MKLCRVTIITLCVLIFAQCFETVAQDKRWLSYEPAIIELEGKLTVVWKYGPPNYGEQAKTDAKLRVPILVLVKPVNVRGNPQDALNAESVEGLRRIQLILFNIKTPYKRLIGKKLIVKGTLLHAHTGHHFTDVVMDVRSIEERIGRR
jgi:hypothetical protein